MEINGIKLNSFDSSHVREEYGTSLCIAPQKVWSLPKNKAHMKETILNSDEYFKLVKKDGYWYQYEKNLAGKSFMFSKTISKKNKLYSNKADNVPHIVEFLSEAVPSGTILVGETYLKGKRSSDVTKVMGCLAPKAIKRQENDEDKIIFYIHDILMYNGTLICNQQNYVRYQILKKVFNDCGLANNKFIELAEEIITDDGVGALQSLFNDGEEGMVLKKKTGIYHPDARPAWELIKFKKSTGDLDVICLGFEPPNKVYNGSQLDTWDLWVDEYNRVHSSKLQPHYIPVTKAYVKNWIGALKIGVYDGNDLIQLGTVSSGLTEVLLEMIKNDPELFINKPLTIGAMEINYKDKTLRHAYVNSKVGYYGFRDDLELTDCTWEKMCSAEVGGN